MKNARAKKNQKVAGNGYEAEEIDRGLDGQSSTSYSLDDDNASQENRGGTTSESKSLEAHNLNGKTRASRGSATDPQSLYARVFYLQPKKLFFHYVLTLEIVLYT